MSKKEKSDAKTEKAAEPTKTVEEMILNYNVGKYSAIPLTALWAKELRRKEEHRHLTATEILDLALQQVLSGDIDWKDVKKAVANGAAEAAEAAESKGK